MKNILVWIVIAAIVAGVGAGLYYYAQRAEAPPQISAETPQAPALPAASEPRVEPPIAHPLPPASQVADAKPLPPLNESDATLQGALSQLVGAGAFSQLLNGDDIVRRMVVTVDNLPRQKMAQRQMPIKAPAGQPITTGNNDQLMLSPDNSARYAAYVQLAAAIDAKKLVTVYVTFYPLFQQAYMELGYPSGYFNDRLIAAIDNLLATPDVPGPIKLVQPKVFYEFADPQLEALSAGQKAMLRLGPENAKQLKAKLGEIRRELVAESPKR